MAKRRAVRIVCLSWLAILAACSGSSDHASAPQPFGEWSLAEDLRIDPVTADLTSGGYMLVARNGDILISQTPDNMIRVFKHDGGTGTIGRGGAGPGEFQRITRIGWIGDTIWTLDPYLSRISFFGPDYSFLHSLRDPSTGLQASPENPVHLLSVQAVLPDGALRAVARPYPNSTPPDWLADVDSGSGAHVRVSVTGQHLGRLGLDPPDPCFINWSVGTNGSGGHVLPFCARPITTDWSGTTNLGSVLVHAADTDSASYRVTVIDHRGDTTMARNFPFTPVPVSQFKLDSAAAEQVERDATSDPRFVSSRPPLTPGTTLPPIRTMVLGRDGTVWLEEEEELPTHQWLVLSDSGDPIGRVTLPANARLRVAERGMVWATITDDDDLVGIVRYRVAPTP